MGIYIKGMEMPTSCDLCWALDDYGDYPRCCITNEQRGYNFPVREQRMGKCPLVPVPPHGRLGDLDAAVEKLKMLREYHKDDSRSAPFIVAGISQCIDILTGRDSATVIPAEEGEG